MKRFLTCFFSFLLTAALFCGFANAADTRASYYLSSYDAFLYTGDSSGELILDFSVAVTRACTSYGISKVRLYTEDGDLVKTITGTKTNGLLTGSGRTYLSEYEISATAGESYYAVVTFYASDANGSDSKTYTTNVAMAKR